MMWFKRESKVPSEKTEKPTENGVVGRLRRKKPVLLKPTRESSERETSTESDKEKRRYSDILDIVSHHERREESDESLYESADGHSDAISASDDAIPRLIKTPTMSKESLKLAVTDEEVEVVLRNKKGHRKTMSLSNPLEVVKTFSDEWFDSKKDLEKQSDKKKSKESLWSEEDRDSIIGSTMKLDLNRKNSKKENGKSETSSRKSSTTDPPKRKSSKSSSVSALNFLRRKKTPTNVSKTVESVVKVADKTISNDELKNYTKLFLEQEKRYSSIRESIRKPTVVETDSDEEPPTPKLMDHRRRLSRQTSRSKSKVRGKSQSVKVNTLRKSHSGTLKKGKKKNIKTTPLASRSRQASVVEQTPVLKKKSSDSFKQNSWLFSGSRGEARREGSTEDSAAADVDVDADVAKDVVDKDTNWRSASSGGRGVNRAESCRERDAPRRGKHRNASDPNRLTATNHHDLEPGAPAAPSESSSSSSLSSRSNESNTVADQHAPASDMSDDEEPLAAQWADSLPPRALDSLTLSPRLRKRQEVIHELIVSEGSHVRWLKVLDTVFFRPLEAAPALLPAEELRGLFPNLPGVRERHCKLYNDLRALRSNTATHCVQIKPVATALLNTLGEAGYAASLSRFCRGQRRALDALKERRRKHKELHQFLVAREQMPLCGRLQLRDLLACVWQRLTKYQLLLESILKTVVEESSAECEGDDPEDAALLKRALDVAKEVLHSVDTAIRTAENEHRLRTIQSKLEVRAPSSAEWEELRRLDLTVKALRMEAELSIRNDTNKKINVLALVLEDCLVLLQREGERFVLKPIPPPSSQQPLLSPLVKWERVLFRPNAAVRNAFFLMNINGVQMHELAANANSDYHNWAKHMEELPLAKPELKPTAPGLTPSHQPSRSTDDSGINVSRNPSDASEKSTSSAPDDNDSERDRLSADRLSERDRLTLEPQEEDKRGGEKEDRRSVDKEETPEREDKHKPRRPTVGRISTHGAEPPPALLDPRALTVQPPAAHTLAHTAERVYTHDERLKRLDEGIAKALMAKSAVVSELLGIPPGSFHQMAELAIADTLGQVDACAEVGAGRRGRERAPDVHQLLLAAQAQANQLTMLVSRALTADEAARAGARARGRCQPCARAHHRDTTDLDNKTGEDTETDPDTRLSALADAELESMGAESDYTYVEPSAEEALESNASAAALASRLVGVSCGLQGSLGRLLAALPALTAHARSVREERVAEREAADARRAAVNGLPAEEISYPKETVDPDIQDQPSNGG